MNFNVGIAPAIFGNLAFGILIANVHATDNGNSIINNKQFLVRSEVSLEQILKNRVIDQNLDTTIAQALNDPVFFAEREKIVKNQSDIDTGLSTLDHDIGQLIAGFVILIQQGLNKKSRLGASGIFKAVMETGSAIGKQAHPIERHQA